MAEVKRIGRKFCVVHSITGVVIQRKAGAACFTTRPAAEADKQLTVRRNFPAGRRR